MSNNFPQKNAENIEKIPLADATVGKCYMIVATSLQGAVALRLAEMGLTCKTPVTVQKRAPLGDPMEISLRGYSLCIRASEAQHFSVVEVSQ